MIIDWQQIANILITAGFGAVGWFYSQMLRDHDHTRQLINDIRIDLPTKYVSKDDLTSHLNRIENMLTKIFDRLEQKVDK
jgi:predicted deacetylase